MTKCPHCGGPPHRAAGVKVSPPVAPLAMPDTVLERPVPPPSSILLPPPPLRSILREPSSSPRWVVSRFQLVLLCAVLYGLLTGLNWVGRFAARKEWSQQREERREQTTFPTRIQRIVDPEAFDRAIDKAPDRREP